MKKLVAFFSATGTTKKVAEQMAKELDADLFEIEPKQKYTSADLDYMDSNSRSTIEMKDKSSRPEIAKRVENLQDYDTVVIGFPVWWYTAPTIINTFIEENDLSGKDIYIFVTSGGSGYKDCLNDLQNAYPKLVFIAGKRLHFGDKDMSGFVQ